MSGRLGFRKFLRISGVDLSRFFRSWSLWSIYRTNRTAFFKQAEASSHIFATGSALPCLWDRMDKGGVARGQYFFQDLMVARWIYERRPVSHIDVGSRVDGFVAHVAVFMKILILDLRDVDSTDPNIEFQKRDIMVDDPKWWDSTESLSCLHALEHFGLGRYGDSIDFEGHVVGFRNMAKMLKLGGVFYFSVPIGAKQRIEFDAHRVFSLPYLLSLIRDNGLMVADFHYVDDKGLLHTSVPVHSDDASLTFNLRNGCGIFELKRS